MSSSGVVLGRRRACTHVGQLSRRLGLSRATDAVWAEHELVKAVLKDHWIAPSNRLTEHGRGPCPGRRLRCEGCGLADLCPRLGYPSHNSRRACPAEAGRSPSVGKKK